MAGTESSHDYDAALLVYAFASSDILDMSGRQSLGVNVVNKDLARSPTDQYDLKIDPLIFSHGPRPYPIMTWPRNNSSQIGSYPTQRC